ncbi:MAG: arginine--tRNA ligase [Candidatus Methanoliparum thermophilum]|uniref:Arginine--tRNA ligase n=2 Tax=Candidatus Methanoliparum TaxID=2545692 RepID=A0A520KRA1_METT2|nr:MAG: arginine--tRNA ligase [Candidatus Methanoliparum thermophilum]BDC35628.1 arginine--tRNA ligase [Candidatus Methanoliparum sp. LAM-1]
MFQKFIEEVCDILKTVARDMGWSGEDLSLDYYDKISDVSSSLAFKISRKDKKNPKSVAEEIYQRLSLLKDKYDLIGDIKLIGPYINFYVGDKFISDTLKEVLNRRDDYGSLNYKGSIVLEHTSANPDGPLHIGHLRNSILGDSLRRILKKAGYSVDVQYYVNDLGRQVAVVVWGIENLKITNNNIKVDHWISQIYIKANRLIEEDNDFSNNNKDIDILLRKFEDGDKDVIEKFDFVVVQCLRGIEQTLNELEIYIDEYVRESQFIFNGDVERIISRLKDTEYAYFDNGALLLDLSSFGFEKDFVVTRSNGTSLYSTRDLAYHAWKARRYDDMIDILGADHKLISSQLKTVLRILGYKEPKVVIFEFISLPEGSMSTRRGKFVSVDELLEKVREQAYLEVSKRREDITELEKKEIANMVAIGAVRYDIIKISPDKPTTFDWRDALNFDKRGAPFIQYSHTRACSILKKGGDFSNPNFDLLRDQNEIDLIKLISRYPLIIKEATDNLRPNILANYSRELAEQFNQFYKDVPVLNAATEELRSARLALVDAFRIVIKDSLSLLGISSPEIM